MRYLLKGENTADALLAQLAQAASHVVEGSVHESVAEDTRMGFYVAFHQILADNLVKVSECGTLPVCEGLTGESPFGMTHPATTRGRVSQIS
jgi:hypothetical protein